MGALQLKKIVVSSKLGRFFDAKLRLSLSLVPYIHSSLTQYRVTYCPDNFVFFLYGGIGDAVLAVNVINKLSRFAKVTVICDYKISGLSFLFSKNVAVVNYDKYKLIGQRKYLIEQISGHFPVFVQLSPIIEVYIIRLMLRIPLAIGFLTSFGCLRSIGFKTKMKKIHSKSRLDGYESIYQLICETFELCYHKENKFDNLSVVQNKVQYDWMHNNAYAVIAAMKSPQWEAGKMPEHEYLKLAEFLVECKNLGVVFVGNSIEARDVDNLIACTPYTDRIINMSGKTDLQELASILINSKIVISNDNGVSHLSSYLNVNTVVLFMFSDPNVYEWKSENYTYIFNKKDDCMPCVSRNFYPQDNYPVICDNNLLCNKSIDSKDVINEIEMIGWLD